MLPRFSVYTDSGGCSFTVALAVVCLSESHADLHLPCFSVYHFLSSNGCAISLHTSQSLLVHRHSVVLHRCPLFSTPFPYSCAVGLLPSRGCVRTLYSLNSHITQTHITFSLLFKIGFFFAVCSFTNSLHIILSITQ